SDEPRGAPGSASGRGGPPRGVRPDWPNPNRAGGSRGRDACNGVAVEARIVSGSGRRPERADGRGALSRAGQTHFGRWTGPVLLDRSGAEPEDRHGPSPLDGGAWFARGLAEEFQEFPGARCRRSGQSVPVGPDQLSRVFRGSPVAHREFAWARSARLA